MHQLKAHYLLHASCILKMSQLKLGSFFSARKSNSEYDEHLLESDSSSESDDEQPDSQDSQGTKLACDYQGYTIMDSAYQPKHTSDSLGQGSIAQDKFNLNGTRSIPGSLCAHQILCCMSKCSPEGLINFSKK